MTAFDDLLRRWLRDRSGSDRSGLQALAGNVAVLPPPQQRRRSPLIVLALAIVLLAALVLALPRSGGTSGEATPIPAATGGVTAP